MELNKEIEELEEIDNYYTNVLQCAVTQELQINNECVKMFPAHHEEIK